MFGVRILLYYPTNIISGKREFILKCRWLLF